MTELELLQYRVLLVSLVSIIALVVAYSATPKTPENKSIRKLLFLCLISNSIIIFIYAI